MAYYDALIAAWNNGATAVPSGATGAIFSGGDTTAQKLAKVNAWTVPGPRIDVPVSAVEGYLSLAGSLTGMEDWLAANTAPSAVRTAVKELLRTVASPHVTVFLMSDTATYAALQQMLGGLESAGLLTGDQVAALMAMAATTIPWWQSSGYPRAFDLGDAAAAELT